MKPFVTYDNPKSVAVFETDSHFEITITSPNGIEQSLKLPRQLTATQTSSQSLNPTLNSSKASAIVRIDRAEDGRQIEIRRQANIPKRPQAKAKSRTNLFKSKLTESQVVEIKSMLSDPKFMATYPSAHKAYKDMGQTYGVSYMTIQLIHKGVTWKHV